ncbi:conserved hypothetical protein [Pediculus humanus corporis]|uniref:Uncharacterized protein n=1 Tax=Pediculus humanus subsp. corporis TaxID=121224 RepID=E0VYY4_PEDHC|nr:uncharacterized protein Phum_PHUM521560 [Pediculus humanus corporis]EEB18590.1 conserved hypothetical protein [Pediculus humanus corporis]
MEIPHPCPPPAGFQIPGGGGGGGGFPQQGFAQPGYPQPGYPKSDYQQPGYGGLQPGAPPAYDSVYGGQPPPQAPNMYGTNYGGEAGDVSGFEFSEKSVRHAFIRKVYGILMCQLVVSLGFIALFLFHNDTRVFLAVAITAVVCFALTVFAFQTKWDFTLMRGGLFVCCIVLFVFGICAMFIKMKIVTLVYSCLAALLFSLYLIFDTQMMMGGKHKYSISPEEYVFAALTLYLDIVNIFMSILTIIGNSRE